MQESEPARSEAIERLRNREEFAGRASALPLALLVQMNGFFRPELLGSTRAVVLENQRVGNPDFYPELEAVGFRNLPDFSGMAAITFNDVIVSHEPFGSPLLFHELVHVEQYKQLGVDRFAELYVSNKTFFPQLECKPSTLSRSRRPKRRRTLRL